MKMGGKSLNRRLTFNGKQDEKPNEKLLRSDRKCATPHIHTVSFSKLIKYLFGRHIYLELWLCQRKNDSEEELRNEERFFACNFCLFCFDFAVTWHAGHLIHVWSSESSNDDKENLTLREKQKRVCWFEPRRTKEDVRCVFSVFGKRTQNWRIFISL